MGMDRHETDVGGVGDAHRYSARQRRAHHNICARSQSPRGTEGNLMRGVDEGARMGGWECL